MVNKTIAILLFCFFSNSKALGQDIEIYGGFNATHMVIKDFEEFDISDLQSPEGRVKVDLRNEKPNSKGPGFVIGGKLSISKNCMISLEYVYGNLNKKGETLPTKSPRLSNKEILVYGNLGAAAIGIEYNIPQKARFTMGFAAKFSSFVVNQELGDVKAISGHTAPFGLIKGAWDMKLKCKGIMGTIGITPKYKINAHFNIIGFLGVNTARVNKVQLIFPSTTGGGGGSWLSGSSDATPPLTMEFNDAYLVKADGSQTPSGLIPTVIPSGLIFNIGISYSYSL